MDDPHKAFQDPWNRLAEAAKAESSVIDEMFDREVRKGEVWEHDRCQMASLDKLWDRVFGNSQKQKQAPETNQQTETQGPSGGSDTGGTSHGCATKSHATGTHEASEPAHNDENGTRNSPVTDTTGRSE